MRESKTGISRFELHALEHIHSSNSNLNLSCLKEAATLSRITYDYNGHSKIHKGKGHDIVDKLRNDHLVLFLNIMLVPSHRAA